MPGKYEVLIGLNLAKTGRRVEPGETTDIPADEVEELLAAGVIRPVEKTSAATDTKDGE